MLSVWVYGSRSEGENDGELDDGVWLGHGGAVMHADLALDFDGTRTEAVKVRAEPVVELAVGDLVW